MNINQVTFADLEAYYHYYKDFVTACPTITELQRTGYLEEMEDGYQEVLNRYGPCSKARRDEFIRKIYEENMGKGSHHEDVMPGLLGFSDFVYQRHFVPKLELLLKLIEEDQA